MVKTHLGKHVASKETKFCSNLSYDEGIHSQFRVFANIAFDVLTLIIFH